MKYWGEYKIRLAKTILGQQNAIENLSYYRNQLFYYLILYTLAFSPIAIVPGIFASIQTGFVNLAILNVATVLTLLILGFVKPIKIEIRKLILILILFIISWTLLFELKLEGPGLMYLFSVTIVTCLIHSGKIAYLLIFINSILLGFIGFNIEFQWLSLAITEGQSITTWFGIVVNLIFLSFVIVGCFEIIFKKLEKNYYSTKTA